MPTPAQKQLLALLLALEAEGDQELIEQQQAQGLAPKKAARPLTPVELRSQVRFADHEDILDGALAQLEALIGDLHGESRRLLMLEVFGEARATITPAEAQQLIHHVVTNQPPAIAATEQAAAGQIATVLAGVYTAVSVLTIQEAVAQGRAPIQPLELTPEVLLPQALAVASHPWRRITTKVEAELTRPAVLLEPAIEPGRMEQVFDTIKVDGTRDEANQAINQTGGRGRIDSAEVLEPDEIWASEIMDGRVCEHCADVDGKDYATLADARADYPHGQFLNCKGGARCRGTLVFLYNET
ncbi:hypothetical protein [Nesterenkonia rhizosphaerae]|uniref:DUF222 domain-containing protein n=1 Tax=Nesterenkonia rhizosphaerae TaxID=1348272 RepID=A0ABP9FTT4_9MICC